MASHIRLLIEVVSLPGLTGPLRNGFNTRKVLAGLKKFDQPLSRN